MRQVEYVGFGWQKIQLEDQHLRRLTAWDTRIKPEIQSWLTKYQSGGYYYIQVTEIKDRYVTMSDPKPVTTLYFSKPQDAMMFKLLWG